MFGKQLDYLILRPLAHRRNLATEEELNCSTNQTSLQSLGEGEERLRRHIERFRGFFPIDPQLRYLDMGCGGGELTIALAKLGCKYVTGIDVLPRNIALCQRQATATGMADAVQFICANLNDWVPSEKFDVLLSFDALEHVENPGSFLRRMADFVAPRGIAVLAFGPLFHSPFGDHMWDFFRLQIPWRGALFAEQALLRIRRECFRPTDAGQSYQTIAVGLNQMRYSDFLNYVREAGWEFRFLAVNPSLRRFPPLFYLSKAITRIPDIRDYFAYSVYAVLRRLAE